MSLAIPIRSRNDGNRGLRRRWPSGGYFDVIDRRTGFWNSFTVSLETFNMKLDSFHNKLAHFLFAVSNHSTSGYVRRIGTVAARSVLNDDRVSFGAHFKPACFSITFRVPGGTS